jgi:hypothetical protein
MAEPDHLILQILRQIRAEVADSKAELKSDIHSLRADVATDIHSLRADLIGVEKKLSEQIVGLRRSVMEYHSSAVGHGILMSEFEERLRRVEQHLNLPASEAH